MTPDDVHHKWFTTARLREGYDLGEVDSFLFDVEFTLDRLYRDNAVLQQQLAAASSAQQLAASDSQGASRIIALADQTVGQAIAAACAEAGRIIGEAQARADVIEREATARAQQGTYEAAEMAADLDRKIREKRSELETMTSSRLTLERQLAGLRGLIEEYRSRMTVQLDDQLEEVERRADEYLGVTVPSQPTGLVHHQAPPVWPRQPQVPQQGSNHSDAAADNSWKTG
ncbi:DivIVA domain-containing protein [Streptomyces sp. NPDC002133]|uniref:DivIVA domain-containing protein n=1 Tax=Streptomyces sp. NPDC002133 TaxID=3154409 RepID=UPI0033181341